MRRSRADIVIVGAGPVGLTIANLLGRHGLKTVVLERNAELFPEPRAVIIDDEALRIYQAIGLKEAIGQHVQTGLRVEYRNKSGRALLELSPADCEYGYPKINSMVQPFIEQRLLEGTNRFPHVDVRFSHTVDKVVDADDVVTVTGQDGTGSPFVIEAEYVLGCDGGRSTVREGLGIRFGGSTYSERFLVFDTSDDSFEPRDAILVSCDPRQMSAVTVPLPHGYRRWEVRLRRDQSEDGLLEPEHLRTVLRLCGAPTNVEIRRAAIYTVHARNADAYRRGRVLLAGDAAHVMPPFGGQGLNAGIRDAHNLAWKLAYVVRSGARPQLLDTFEEERRPHAQEMMQMSERLGLITSVANLPHAIAIEVILTLASSIPPLARFLREAKFRPVPRLTGGFRWNSGRKDSRAGELLRQPTVQRTTGEAIPLDGLLGDHFTVLGVGSRGLGRSALEAWTRWGARYAHVGAANAECYVPERANDTAFALKEWLGNVEGRFLLIRPDRYIAADFSAGETPAVLAALQRLLPSCESTAVRAIEES